jgi:hypothetical protein
MFTLASSTATATAPDRTFTMATSTTTTTMGWIWIEHPSLRPRLHPGADADTDANTVGPDGWAEDRSNSTDADTDIDSVSAPRLGVVPASLRPRTGTWSNTGTGSRPGESVNSTIAESTTSTSTTSSLPFLAFAEPASLEPRVSSWSHTGAGKAGNR